jgi:hypothetical protein
MMIISRICTFTFISLGIVSAAHASTITQTAAIPFQELPLGGLVASFGSFNSFDTTLGTLTDVVVTLSGTAQVSGSFFNTSSASQTFTFAPVTTARISGPTPLINDFGGGTFHELDIHGPVQSFTIAGNATSAFSLASATNSKTATYTNSTDLLAFESGNFNIGLVVGLFGVISGSILIDSTAVQSDGDSISIAYDFSPVTPAVPEPSTWAMMLLGFAGIGYMAYRRNSKTARMAL